MLVGPTIRRRRLGNDLRRLREARSLKLEDVAIVLGVAASTLSRIETGKMPTRTSYLTVMLDLYGVADEATRRGMLQLAREGQRRGWWTDAGDLLPAGYGTYLDLEAEASSIRAFETLLVPGLLRTPEYARAVVAAGRPDLTPAQVEQVTAVQQRRPEALAGPDAVRLRLILDESVLLRSIGPEHVRARQLEHLVTTASLPNVTLQVLGLSGSRPALSASFGILSFADPDGPDVLCAKGLRGQVYLDERPAEVRAMAKVFETLTAAAMPEPRSVERIRELAASRP